MASKTVMILAVIVGVVSCDSCVKERVKTCMDEYTNYIRVYDQGKEDQYVACRAMREAQMCIGSIRGVCGDHDELQKLLKNMLQQVLESCPEEYNYVDHGAIDKCVAANWDYFQGCRMAGVVAARTELGETTANQDFMRCMTYSLAIDCQANRVREKCGRYAQYDLLSEADEYIPDEVRDQCLSKEDFKEGFSLCNEIYGKAKCSMMRCGS